MYLEYKYIKTTKNCHVLLLFFKVMNLSGGANLYIFLGDQSFIKFNFNSLLKKFVVVVVDRIKICC